MQIIRSGLIVAFFTFISRIFGYIRDIFMAYYLGLNADSFAVAFRLPNTFRTLFGEGALSSAFVPLFAAKFASNKDHQEAFTFANRVFSLLFLTLLFFVCVMIFFMPYIIKALAPGFANNPEKLDLTISLAYFTMPYLFFISLCSLYAGVLNSIGRFAIASALPIVLNITMILAVKYLTPFSKSPSQALAVGVFIAGILQLSIIAYSAYLMGVKMQFTTILIDKDMKTMFKNMVPAIIGSGVVQINLAIDTIIASFIDGAASIIYFADRLNQFPLAIIGTALSTVLLPTLSRQIRENKLIQAQETQTRSIELALLLTLPCSVAFFIMGDSIISLLFERGSFSSEDSIKVARALAALALGLPAFVMNKIFTPRFLAEHDTATPVKVSMISIVINIVASLILIQFFSYVGIAIATSLSGWISISLLAKIQANREIYKFSKNFRFYFFRVLIACSIMSGFLLIFEINKNLYCSYFSKFIILSSEIVICVLIYFTACYWLKLINFNLKGFLRK